MEIIHWDPISRKRNKSARYTDEDFVNGYDLDMEDFSSLTTKYNAGELLREEEQRLHLYVMTLMKIVLENPKIMPRNTDELDKVTDAMFVAMWGSLRYIKDGRSPYSYLYRSGYTSACTWFKKQIKEREKEESIRKHCEEVYLEYMDSISDHKVSCSQI